MTSAAGVFNDLHLRTWLTLAVFASIGVIVAFTRRASQRTPSAVADDGWDRNGRRRIMMAIRLAMGETLPGVRVLPPALAGIWALRVSTVALVLAWAGALIAGA